MGLLIIGLALFVGVHLIPSSPALRAALTGRLGLYGYKYAFWVLSIASLVLIVWGYGVAPEDQIFPPSVTAQAVLPYAMALAFVLMAIAYAPGRLRRVIRHPMLAAVLIWSSLHFLANGDLASNVLFGTFAVWSVFAILSAIRRGQKIGGEKIKPWADAVAAAIGLVAWAIIWTLHPILFGPSPI